MQEKRENQEENQFTMISFMDKAANAYISSRG